MTYKQNTDGTYQCVQCKPYFKLVDVYDISNKKTSNCLQIQGQTIPFCTAYVFNIKDKTYYCKSNGCSDGSLSIPIDIAGNLWCTKLKKYRFGSFGACDYYDKPALSTTFLSCPNCNDVLRSVPFCLPDPSTSSCTYPLIEVTVNGIKNCAMAGFISSCEVYETIDSKDSLYGCKKCESGSLLVDLYIGLKACVPKLFNGCLIYAGTTECYLFSALSIVNPVIITTRIINCQDEKVVKDNFYVCNICKNGYVRGFQGERCIKLVEHCSVYSKTLDNVCTLCIKDYFLLNNQCIKKSSNCLSEDQSGKCQVCSSEFRVSNGICELIPLSTTCSEGQYRNSQSFCVQGMVKNCQTYTAATGECSNCKAGFEFDPKLECKSSQIICPNSNDTTKYFIQFTKCIPTDLHCESPNQDGSCISCEEGFYQNDGKCIQIPKQSQILKEGVSTQLQADDFGNSFYVDKNKNKKFLMGSEASPDLIKLFRRGLF